MTNPDTPPKKTPDPWQGILEPGEEILWQGRPDTRLRFDFSQPMLLLMGVFFMGFSLFWMSMAMRGGGPFWMFGLLFFGIGFFNAIGVHFWKTYKRTGTYYTLTNKRGFIATNLMGIKTLKSHDITADTVLELAEGKFDTVTFAQDRKSGKNGSYLVPVRFEYIENGRDVFGKIRNIQQAKR